MNPGQSIQSSWIPDARRLLLVAMALVVLLMPARALAAFGYTDTGTSYVVDSGGGLVFEVNKANGDIISILWNGTEYKSTTGRFSHIASGLGSTGTSVSVTSDGTTYVKITIQTDATNGVAANLTHYLVARNGDNAIYMATFPTAEPGVGELRWITRLNHDLIPNGPVPSDLTPTTGAIESTDVFGVPDGTTRSKYYGDNVTHGKDRAMDLVYDGATGSGIGCWMVFGSRESSSGGPFFRDIQNQAGTDQEIYNYMNSGHNQTEANRLNVLHGPYALVFTTGAPPTLPIDFSWMGDLGLTGWVPASGRGTVSGTVTGIPAGFQGVVGFANASAQYWATVGGGSYASTGMKPGTYTATLYKGELAVATASVAVTPGATTSLNLASTEVTPSTIFRVGDWDGTPAGFSNGDKIVQMHPQDVRMTPWDTITYSVGVDDVSRFPAIQFRGKNSPTTILFNLAPNQIANLTLRIGITCAYNSGRPQITVNSFTSSQPAASAQPNSRSFTIGTYRGNNALFTYTIPASALVVGTNTLTINPISGSTDLGTWLSAGWVYDAVELDGPIATPVITYVGGSPLVVSGTSEPGRSITLTLDGSTPAGGTTAGADGTWSIAFAGALSGGLHTFTAVASDGAGHSSPVSAAFAFNSAIVMPVIVSAVGDTGVYSSGATTSDRVFSFTGTAGAGDTVALTRVGTGVIGTVVASSDGSWSFDYTSVSLPDGTNAFFATSSSGGASGPSSPVFTLNLQGPPRIAITREIPTNEVITAGLGTVVFRVTFNHLVSGVTNGAFAVTTTDNAAGTVVGVSANAGSSFDVTVGALAGTGTLRLDLKANSGIIDGGGNPEAPFTAGQHYTLVVPTFGNGTWARESSGGLWSDPQNWVNAVIADGSSSNGNFSTLDLQATNTVHLDTPRTINSLTFGDTNAATAASWIVDAGGAGNVLTFGGSAPTVTVNPLGTGATTTLSLRVAGTDGLTKAGTGTLVLSADNPLTGVVNVNAGSLQLVSGGALDIGGSALNLALNGRLSVAGGSFATTGIVTATTAQVVVDGGSAALGGFRSNSDFGTTLRVNGGTLSVADVNIRRNSAAAPDFGSGFIVAGSGVATAGTIELGSSNSTGAMSIEGNGSLTASGIVTVGNQATSGRGGALRVLNAATFTATEPTLGVLMCRNPGANANNVASATFSGGVSTVEKFTLGFDSTVTAGSATITLNGGSLYLGSGGIVKNGAAGLATNLNFGSGVLGAKANWATALAINLPSGGTVSFKAGDAADAPNDVTFAGPLVGAGGFSKTGRGTLTLTAANTFTGPLSVSAGALRVDGSIGAGTTVGVVGGTLAGGGTVSRDLLLDSGGTIQPGTGTAGTALTVSSLTWNGGGTLAVDLASGNRLIVVGALQKGTAGSLLVSLSSSAPLSIGTRYTLATFASTNAVPPDFLASGLANDQRGVFLVLPGALQFLVTGSGPAAAYTDWAYRHALPAGQDGPDQDPDGDGSANVLEFVLGTDPLRPNAQPIAATTVEIDGLTYPAISFPRRRDLVGVGASVLASPDAAGHALLDTGVVSQVAQGDGTDLVVIRSLVPLSEQPRQFFRLAATYPAPEITLRSRPLAVMTQTVQRGVAGLALPLIAPDLVVGVVSANTASTLTFADGVGNVGASLTSGVAYYVEVTNGPLEGERFDVDTEATIAAAGQSVVLSLGPDSLSTRSILADASLVGGRCVLRPHLTLQRLQAMLAPGLIGNDEFLLADAVQVFENGGIQRYYLRADGVTWSLPGNDQDFRAKVLPPDESFFVESHARPQAWLQAGGVRTNAFRKNLVVGFQPFASGFPVDLSPVQIGGFVDPNAPAASRWTGNNAVVLADQIEILLGDPMLFQLYYLRGDGTSWRAPGGKTNFANQPILGATNAVLLRRVKPDDGYRIRPPFEP